MLRYEIINALAEINRANTYLEVGVEGGVTFEGVRIKNKIAVDPVKRFAQSSGLFYEMTSDDFFKENSKFFDFIFLDGMHRFEYILRDLINATKFASNKCIIIIDDVIPTDVFSQLRSQSLCDNIKIEKKFADRNWMGDVYKVIPFVDSIFLDWSYKTITSNHGQSILWREPRSSNDSEQCIKFPDFTDVLLGNVPYNFDTFDNVMSQIASAYSRD